MSKHAKSKLSYLALIPARAGSKRLPHKNELPLAGKPLIQWSIEAAKQAGVFEHVVVSTDSESIRDIALKAKAEVPFMRPEHLAGDQASSVDVATHCLDFFQSQGLTFDYLVLLQPTSPLRSADDIVKAIKLLEAKQADAVISVCASNHPPHWMNTLPADHSMNHFLAHMAANKRSQDLGQYYQLNGALYVVKVASLQQHKSFFVPNSVAYVMPQERSVDIDTKIDFKLAELLLS